MPRRTEFQGSSAGRRRERRKLAAMARGVEADETVISSSVMHRPTPSKVELACKRNASSRVEKAVMVRDTPVYDKLNNCCLPQVHIYRAGHRRQADAITAR